MLAEFFNIKMYLPYSKSSALTVSNFSLFLNSICLRITWVSIGCHMNSFMYQLHTKYRKNTPLEVNIQCVFFTSPLLQPICGLEYQILITKSRKLILINRKSELFTLVRLGQVILEKFSTALQIHSAKTFNCVNSFSVCLNVVQTLTEQSKLLQKTPVF